MTSATKYENRSSDNAGSVAYEYCLACDSAMSRRLVYGPAPTGQGSTRGPLLEGQRFVYDGLTLYRVDQLYDSDSDGVLPQKPVHVE